MTANLFVIVWPQISGFISTMILLPTLGYVAFQRWDARAESGAIDSTFAGFLLSRCEATEEGK